MSDQISKLRGLTGDMKPTEETLLTSFTDLSLRLKEAAGDHVVWGESDNVTLESYGDDDAIYGHLYFDDDGLVVVSRSSEEDVQDAHENNHWGPSFHHSPLDKCKPVWLRALATPAIVESLLTNINKRVEDELNATQAGIQTLSATANLPLRDLDTGLIAAAKKLDFGSVIEHWKDAQTALGVDPPDAITRACSLIETLCKHILAAKGIPLLNNQAIQDLYGAASKALGISPATQASADLRALMGGMTTVVISIGALRTHAGSAHGKGPDHEPATFAQARLAVNAAGVLATFLMDTLSAEHPTA